MRTAVDTGTVQEYMACLSEKVRRLINAYDMEETREMICEAMKEYPDAAQPHNLLGILFPGMDSRFAKALSLGDAETGFIHIQSDDLGRTK